jgi:hypothetical protein
MKWNETIIQKSTKSNLIAHFFIFFPKRPNQIYWLEISWYLALDSQFAEVREILQIVLKRFVKIFWPLKMMLLD